MRVSVVVCTYNRADGLAATLDCLRHQRHEDFEVIVVNGPSTDHTLDVLEPWKPSIKVRQNDQRNLSVSRNIGIAASSGDVVAFIDDDALPEADWLRQALAPFDDPEIAGTGGIVFDHTGRGLQWKFGAIDRFGDVANSSSTPFDEQCFPGSFQMPYLQGTNALFRRDRLYEIRGFDETYDFYLDETDVCVRLIDAGWRLRQLPNAAVHHKYLPSAIRDHQRITRNWFPVIKNHTYFTLRHASAMFPEQEILARVHDAIGLRVNDTRFHADAGRLDPEAVDEAKATCLSAFATGLALGRDGLGRELPILPDERCAFLPFPKIDTSSGRKLTLVTSGYTGNMTGGIARMFIDLASGLAARGHDVRVVTKATEHAAVDFEDGVWVHRVDVPSERRGVAPEAPAAIDAFATAVVREVERISSWAGHDVVFGPAWDVEVLGALRETTLPVAVHVATPVAVAADMAGLLEGAGVDELNRLMQLEREVFGTADVLQANTRAGIATIQDLYGESCDPDRWSIANLGLVDRRTPTTAVANPKRVLFVGRHETRKGIDVVLSAMEPILEDDEDVELVLVGEDRPLKPGQPNVGRSWLDRHRDRPWASRVDLRGVVGEQELHDAYAGAAVVVMPSRYESFGLAMAEVLMHGRPLVSTTGGGIPEVVRDGVDGLLVAPGDVAATEAAIRRVLSDDQLAERLATSARERYEAEFSIEPYVRRFEVILRSADVALDAVDVPVGTAIGPGGSIGWRFGCGQHGSIHLRALVDSAIVDERERKLSGGRIHRLRVPRDGRLSVLQGKVEFAGATVVHAGTAEL